MDQKATYDGDVLTDITSFSMIQNIFDGEKKEINRSQIDSLDSIIQLLIFYDNIWIVEPSIYGGDVGTESQIILNTLIEDDVIKQVPQLHSGNDTDFDTQIQEIKKIIETEDFGIYYQKHPEIIHDLQIYDQNFCLTTNKKAIELADRAHLEHKYIPLCANLLRANYYFKHIQQMKHDEGKIITYSPNVLRNSLVKDIIRHQDAMITNNIDKILQDQLASVELSVKKRKKIRGQVFENDLTVELPLMTTVLVDECKNKDDFFDHIFTWREDPDTINIRKWLKKLQNDLSTGNGKYEESMQKLHNYTHSFGTESTIKADLFSFFTDTSLLRKSVV